MALIKCGECGNEVSDTAKTCPKCGFKIESHAKEEKKEKTKVKTILIVAVLTIIIALGGLGFVFYNKHRIETYKENYEEILSEIIHSGSEIEDCLILYRKVWYNTIFEKDDSETDIYTKNSSGKFNDDFNDSLTNLWISSEYSNQISKIKSASMDTIPSIFKKLKNPPKKMEDAFEDLEELYDTYLSFAEMAINPSGSLNSFTDKYNELDDKLATQYKKAYRNIE